MKRIKYIVLFLMILGGAFSTGVYAEPEISLNPAVEAQASTNNLVTVAPGDVVKLPRMYLNKTIKFKARFDKFSTVGLDYPPALRKTEDYISFMVYRDDTSFDIPLSEMKLFMKRDDAQKFIDLKSKDKVEVTGRVFSTALGDPWVDVLKMEIVK